MSKKQDSKKSAAKKAVAKVARKAAKKTATKTATKVAKKVAKKTAKKTARKAARKATRTKAGAPEAPAAENALPAIDLATAAYLNYLARVQNGLPGDALSDWVAAEQACQAA